MTEPAPLLLVEAEPVARPWGGHGVPSLGLAGAPGETIGEYWLPTTDFPLLVKILDAREHLSVQLHPDDEIARERGLKNGKSEAWVVLEAAPGAGLWLGLRPGEDPASFLAAAERGEDVSSRLVRFEPAPGDFFYVPAGTVHALGAGLTVLEIQQPSDVTYRVWDWNRRPPRPLHLADARGALRARTGAFALAADHPGSVLDPKRPPEGSPGGAEARTAAGAPGDPGAKLLVDGPHFRIATLEVGEATDLVTDRDPELFFVRSGRGNVRAGAISLDLKPGTFFLTRGRSRSIQIRSARPADAAASLELVRISPR